MDARNKLPEDKRNELDRLARSIVRDSIAEKAVARLVSQVIAEINSEAVRLLQVRNTIRINAIKGMGCTKAEADAYANGTAEKTFVEAMTEHIEARTKEG